MTAPSKSPKRVSPTALREVATFLRDLHGPTQDDPRHVRTEAADLDAADLLEHEAARRAELRKTRRKRAAR